MDASQSCPAFPAKGTGPAHWPMLFRGIPAASSLAFGDDGTPMTQDVNLGRS